MLWLAIILLGWIYLSHFKSDFDGILSKVTPFNQNNLISLGKGSKIKLIIFAEFFANGGVKIISFLKCSENAQNALKHEKKLKT